MEAGKAAAARIQKSFNIHEEHKTRVLQEVSNTYKLMLAESKRQADQSLALQRDFGERQLAVQQQALEVLRSTSARVVSLVDQNSLF